MILLIGLNKTAFNDFQSLGSGGVVIRDIIQMEACLGCLLILLCYKYLAYISNHSCMVYGVHTAQVR